MKQIATILLCSVILFGCSKQSNQDKIIGEWKSVNIEGEEVRIYTFTGDGKGFSKVKEKGFNLSFDYRFLDEQTILYSNLFLELTKDGVKKEKDFGNYTMTLEVVSFDSNKFQVKGEDEEVITFDRIDK